MTVNDEKSCESLGTTAELGGRSEEAIAVDDNDGDGRPANSEPFHPAECGVGDDFSDHGLVCCVCLDLMYKPVVLACGHISCFWCVHQAMQVFRESHCPLCRQPYYYFPSICQVLHQLLIKIEPVAYKRRESEVLVDEKKLDIYSPQFDPMIASQESDSSEVGIVDGTPKKISKSDVLCLFCKELLYRPVVLNCGHVYCESCLPLMFDEKLKCQVCASLHPGDFPAVCLDLDHFIASQFPAEYALRLQNVENDGKVCHHQDSSTSSALSDRCKKKSKYESDLPAASRDYWSDVHIGVGCDSCGMYPIKGKRYKCIDCTEVIGFDLCGACYNTNSKLPGRFNQHHRPNHRFELNESSLISRLWLSLIPDGDVQGPAEAEIDPDLPDENMEETW